MKFVCIMGRSGSSKSTVESYLEKLGYKRSISFTTRKPRDGEQNGKDYFFVNEKKFMELVNKGIIIEYENNYGNLYGTQAPVGSTKYVGVLGLGGVRALKDKYGSQVISIYLECDKAIALDRIYNRDKNDKESLSRADEDDKITAEMKKEADYIIDSNRNINEIIADILLAIKQ